MSNVLKITNLRKAYGRTIAVDGVSFSVESGKIVGLLGPNGSGKTTILKIIMGLLSDYEGEVSIAARNIPVMPGALSASVVPDATSTPVVPNIQVLPNEPLIPSGEPLWLSPGVKANHYISYLPDACHVPGWFTGERAMSFFADFYEDFDRAKAGEMLDSMQVPRRKQLRHLSRGMYEKVQLALVMSRRASLYVLDEPIGAVDPAGRDFILNTILANYAESASILLTSHIIADIEGALDTVIFLKNGKVHTIGDSDTLREKHGMSLDALFREVFRNE